MTYIPPWSPDFTNESNVVPAQGSIDIPAPSTDLGKALHDAITVAQQTAAQQVEQVVIGALQQTIPAAPTGPVVVEPKDITNAAARGRALRSLFYGLGLTVFWALVTAIGDAVSGGQVDFFTKTGWISVAALAAGTIAHAALSYIGRVKLAPNSPE